MAPTTLNFLRLLAVFGLLGSTLTVLGQGLGGWIGAAIALGITLLLVYVCWFQGDRRLLRAYGAQPLTRKQAPKLYRFVQDLCKLDEMPRPRIYGIDSPTANAFSTGRDRHHATLVVTQGLLDLLEDIELEAIVAHELCHIQRQDCLAQTAIATLADLLSWPGRILFFRQHRPSGNPLGSLLALLFAPPIAVLVHIGLGQGRDLAADHRAVRLTRKPRALAQALEKLDGRAQRHPLLGNPAHQGSLLVLGPTNNIFSNLFATHPAVRDRLEQLDLIGKDMIRRDNDSAIRAMNLN